METTPVTRRIRSLGGKVYRKIFASQPAARHDSDLLDVRELIKNYSVEELATAANEYYEKMEYWDYYYQKPLTNVDETPDFLISFSTVVNAIRPLPNMKVMDFGAGSAWTTRYLCQIGCAATAVDVSKKALQLGKEMMQRLQMVGEVPEPEFAWFDGRKLPFADNTFDRIVCFDAFHHVPNPQEVLFEMARVLKDGGIAGFSEPGPHHSKHAQSQYEMRHYTVIENDINVREIERMSKLAGFTSMKLAAFNTGNYEMSISEHEAFLRGESGASRRYWKFMRDFMSERTVFFLNKGETRRSNSFDRRGLAGTIEARLDQNKAQRGKPITGMIKVRNTGDNHWLPSRTEHSKGHVNVGVHLLDQDGVLRDRDFARVMIPSDNEGGVEPREELEFPFEISGPQEPGKYLLEFDLVSEFVCWFEINGTIPVKLDLEITP